MTLTGLQPDRLRLDAVARRFRIARLEVFGSFATGDASEESDLDLLVTFEPDARIGLEFITLKQELEAIFGRPVDLLTRVSVERSENKYFRHFALAHTASLYERAWPPAAGPRQVRGHAHPRGAGSGVRRLSLSG